ncbi:MAG: xanthine dehydrogenase YagS FAD-binding subunit [Acetobacteraceae bacterium]|nr:xanthine dehydrogenase YagS FAD-binding subunit [Acetobacteraceae bacterium]
MQAFTLTHPADKRAAVVAGSTPGTKYIAGGTDLLQLAKDNIETPAQLVDLEPLGMAAIHIRGGNLRLEPLARMSDVAAHPEVVKGWPVLSQALLASASPQIRNMATMGGNLLQRTRCGYFRDTGFACNKRVPGSGCPAINGENRMHAILGGSDHCIATNPGDMAVAMMVLGAELELTGHDGMRTVPIGDFHKLPGDTPNVETVLQPGEMITAIDIPASAAAKRSHYLKVRDRASFEFALVSAAVALELDGGTVRSARVAAGGVGTKPWRLPEVEDALTGKQADAASLKAAADQAGAGANPAHMNAFKLVLLRRTVLRALQTVSA